MTQPSETRLISLVPTCLPLFGLVTFHLPNQKSNCRNSDVVHAGGGGDAAGVGDCERRGNNDERNDEQEHGLQAASVMGTTAKAKKRTRTFLPTICASGEERGDAASPSRDHWRWQLIRADAISPALSERRFSKGQFLPPGCASLLKPVSTWSARPGGKDANKQDTRPVVDHARRDRASGRR